jgi:UDP-N-acetylmuramyl tripeptide synthase
MLEIKKKWKSEKAPIIKMNIPAIQKMIKALPYKLTDSQRKSAWEILKDMEAGLNDEVQHSLTISDRAQAIKTAIMLAQAGDILLIAGKGHEKYQEINGVKHDFDDFQLTEEFFNQLKK